MDSSRRCRSPIQRCRACASALLEAAVGLFSGFPLKKWTAGTYLKIPPSKGETSTTPPIFWGPYVSKRKPIGSNWGRCWHLRWHGRIEQPLRGQLSALRQRGQTEGVPFRFVIEKLKRSPSFNENHLGLVVYLSNAAVIISWKTLGRSAEELNGPCLFLSVVLSSLSFFCVFLFLRSPAPRIAEATMYLLIWIWVPIVDPTRTGHSVQGMTTTWFWKQKKAAWFWVVSMF